MSREEDRGSLFYGTSLYPLLGVANPSSPETRGSPNAHKNFRQHHDKPGEIGANKKDDDENDNHGPDGPADIFQGTSADGAGYEDIDGHGGGGHTDGQADGEDDPKMDKISSHGVDEGQEDGGQNDQTGGRFHKTSGNQDYDVDH
jgi:hypothetical protein